MGSGPRLLGDQPLLQVLWGVHAYVTGWVISSANLRFHHPGIPHKLSQCHSRTGSLLLIRVWRSDYVRPAIHLTPRPAYAEYLRCERGLVVSEDNDRRASVVDSAFDDTLLVELTEVQHFGQLKIDFVARGTVQSHMNAFDTAADKLYREAVRHILRGVEGGALTLPSNRPATFPLIEMRPIVFRNAVPETDRKPPSARQRSLMASPFTAGTRANWHPPRPS